MRAAIQRVERASVTVQEEIIRSIGKGLLVLLGVETGDGEDDLAFLKKKILNLRIFNDSQCRMNLSVREVEGEVLLISQFTLYGDCRKGNRPSYSRAAPPLEAHRCYERLIEEIRSEGISVKSGEFQTMMKVTLVNDGPVTLIVDSRRGFY